jgi:2-desacetyl-2-hydroxyethyl bacteriochlorophyllide A dehydrogenase
MNHSLQQSQAVVVRAEDAPRPGSPGISPCHRYRFPQVSLESRPLGELAADKVRVEMAYAGICGTDLHLVQSDPDTGYVLTSAPAAIPREGRVIGHEGVGRVIAAGPAANGLRPGDFVAFSSILACMHCEVCRRGAFNQCPQSLLLGMEIDGLFASVVDVPASLAHDVSSIVRSEADLRAAACLEPAGVALLACENAKVSPGDSVLVFGGGPIGIFSAMLSKRVLGAVHVALVEPMEARRAVAREWCDAVYDVEEFFGADAGQFDVVIEGSGNLANVNRAFRRIGPNGRVVLLGRSGAPLEINSVDHMITNAITIAGSRGHLGGVLSRAIALYQAGLLPLAAVITGELDSLEKLLETLRNPDGLLQNHCKVVARVNRQSVAG